MLTLVDALRDNAPFLVAAIILLIFALFFIIFLVLRKARKRESPMLAVAESDESAEAVQEPPQPEAATAQIAQRGLKPSFARGVEQLKASVPGHDYRYHVPWFLFLAEDQSQDALLPQSLPRSLALEEPIKLRGGDTEALRWWFFDAAVILTIGRDFLLKSDRDVARQNKWLALLKLIRKTRPERPLDGLILSVPSIDLLRALEAGHEGIDQLMSRADSLRATLHAIPATLGMRLPVYCIVTGCEAIDGFSSLGSVLPKSAREQIFGWSSPYPVEETYESDWVDQAFRELQDDLYHIQFQTFAEHGDLPGNDGLFIFPDRFDSLKQPLQDYLDRVFRRSAYYDAFLFRGIYFSGTAEIPVERAPEAGLPPLSTREEAPRALPPPARQLIPSGVTPKLSSATKPLFIEDLFRRKIFPEAGLAHPIDRFRAPQNAKVRVLQAAVALVIIFMAVATFYSKPRLAADRESLHRLLTVIKNELPAKGANGQELRYEAYIDNPQKLLYAMRDVKEDWYGSWVMPTSWFDSLRDDITTRMTLAYQHVLLKSLHVGLQRKSGDITSDPENKVLQAYISDLGRLEDTIALYETLRQKGQGDLSKLREVVTYLGFAGLEQESLGENFDRNVIFQRALKDSELNEPFSYQDYRDDVVDKLYFKIEGLYETEIRNHPLVVDVQKLTVELNRLEDSLPTTYDELEALQGDIARARASTENPQYAWLSKKEFDPKREFPTVGAYLSRSVFLDPGADSDRETEFESAVPQLMTYFEDLGRQRFDEEQTLLAQADSELTGKVLVDPGAEGRWALSKGVNDLGDWLKRLLDLAQGWPATEPDFEFAYPIRWNLSYIREAIQLYKSYEKVTDEVPRTPPGGPEPAVERLQGRLVTLLRRADRSQSRSGRSGAHQTPADFVSEIESFVLAAESLRTMLDTLDTGGLNDTYEALSRLIASQATHILEHLDEMLVAEQSYMTRDHNFSWWMGEQPVSFLAFNLDSDGERLSYLRGQRLRVEFLANQYAKPTIDLLLNTAAVVDRQNNPSVTRWRGIVSQLESYKKQDVNSSLAALERFIEVEMDQSSPGNCGDPAPPSTMSQENLFDFFLEKRNELERQFIDRCNELTRSHGVARYNRIARAFNDDLSGHFPFSENLPPGISRSPLNRDANPSRMSDFFDLLDNDGPAVLKFLEESATGINGREGAVSFLKSVNEVRNLFADLLGTSQGADPAFDFEVTFRENRERRGAEREECGVNQIINWHLAVGKQEFQYPDLFSDDSKESGAPARGRWNYNDPIVVTLRWAKNSPCFPVVDPGKAGLEVDENTRTAIVQYLNPWSVFALLRENASIATDFPDLVEHPDILKISIPVLPSQQRSAVRELAERRFVTSAFMRFLIRPPGKPEEELLAPVFPTQAPLLPIEAMDRLSQRFSR